MEPSTRRLWAQQNRHKGDRKRLFTAVRDAVGGSDVLYPGSFVDIAASFAYPSVTYVDTDKRTPKFFADIDGIREIISSEIGPLSAEVAFIHGDYTEDLNLADQSFDLLVSLYAGLVSEHCTHYLRIGGVLLVAPSHGDAAMASIDDRYELDGVVTSRSGVYRVKDENLDSYLIPKSPIQLTPDLVRQKQRGIPYTKTTFAYLFRRTK